MTLLFTDLFVPERYVLLKLTVNPAVRGDVGNNLLIMITIDTPSGLQVDAVCSI